MWEVFFCAERLKDSRLTEFSLDFCVLNFISLYWNLIGCWNKFCIFKCWAQNILMQILVAGDVDIISWSLSVQLFFDVNLRSIFKVLFDILMRISGFYSLEISLAAWNVSFHWNFQFFNDFLSSWFKRKFLLRLIATSGCQKWRISVFHSLPWLRIPCLSNCPIAGFTWKFWKFWALK